MLVFGSVNILSEFVRRFSQLFLKRFFLSFMVAFGHFYLILPDYQLNSYPLQKAWYFDRIYIIYRMLTLRYPVDPVNPV